MTIEEFELLNEAEKEEAVWNGGIFLINYDEGKEICDVYELHDFFVSFCYELNRNEKAQIIAKPHPDQLPHLFKIMNIPG